MNDFFNMGGYGSYIWPAYLTVFIVLLSLGVSSFKTQIKLKKQVEVLKEKRRSKMKGKN